MKFPAKYASDSDSSTGFALFRVYELWSAAAKRALRPVGVTHPQFTVMTVISYLSLDSPIHGYYATPSECANATAAAQQASSLPSRRRRRYHTHLESLATPAIGESRLGRTTPTVSQADVAAMSGIDPMTVSGIVRNLEKHGLLTRTRSPTDTRAWNLALTPAGQQALAQAFPLVEAANDEFFATLEDEPGFRAQLHQLRAGTARSKSGQ